MTPLYPLILITGAVYSGLIFLRPIIAIYLLIFFSVFDLGFFTRWFHLSSYFARSAFLISFLLIPVFTTQAMLGKIVVGNVDKEVHCSLKLVFALSLLAVISCIYNAESMIFGLYELRFYYMFVIFLLSFKYYLYKFLTIDKFILFCVTLGLIQIPVTIIQYSFVQFFGVRLAQSALDMSSGTFSAYPALVFCQCIASVCILEYHLIYNKRLLKLNNYFVMILLIIPLLLSNSRIAMGYIFLSYIFVYITDIFYNKKTKNVFTRTLSLVIVVSVLLILFLQFFFNVHNYTLNTTFIIDYFMQDSLTHQEYKDIGSVAGYMGRGRAVVESCKLISDNIFTFLFGMGSGSTSEASLLGMHGKYYYIYGPFAGVGRLQFSKIIAELGFLGAFSLIVFYSKIFFYSRPIPRETQIAPKLFIDIMFILILTSLYDKILMTEISMLITAYIIAVMFREENE